MQGQARSKLKPAVMASLKWLEGETRAAAQRVAEQQLEQRRRTRGDYAHSGDGMVAKERARLRQAQMHAATAWYR